MPNQPTPPDQHRPTPFNPQPAGACTTRRWPFVVAALGLVVVAMVIALIAVATGSSDLKADDPEGHEACWWLNEGRATEDIEVSMGSLLKAGDFARLATTPEIRATVEKLDDAGTGLVEDINVPDVDMLKKACEAHGFDIAEVERGG